jgi:membrane-anchored mycosin MYCP
MRRRRLVRALPALTVLPLLLASPALAAGAPAEVPAKSHVKLPVMPSVVQSGEGCTKGSAKVASAVPWEQHRLGLPSAWQFSTGKGVKVAVVDTGVSQKAPALKGHVSSAGGGGTDCVGHGSFVAGLISAAPVKGVHFAGVAQRAEIVGTRGTNAHGEATASSIAGGIQAAVSAGAKVIEVSPAVSQKSAALSAAVSDAAQHDALVVAAAVPDMSTLNMSTSNPPPRDYWPASLPGVLSVTDLDKGGAHPSDAVKSRHADLSAPGDGVVGIGPSGPGHFIGSGASLAAAYTAGTAALVRSAHPGMSAAQTARQLTASAYPGDVPQLDPYASLTSIRDKSAGHATASPQAGPVHLPSDRAEVRATHRALVLAGVGGGLVLLVAAAAALTPLGRARRWRPAGRRAVSDQAS